MYFNFLNKSNILKCDKAMELKIRHNRLYVVRMSNKYDILMTTKYHSLQLGNNKPFKLWHFINAFR